MTRSLFVVCGLVRNMQTGKYLILKKADDDYNYPGRWTPVGGFVKEFEPGQDTIIREIKEETGLDAAIVKKGEVTVNRDAERDIEWITLPFLCEVKESEEAVKLDPENTAFAWVTKEEMKAHPFVPGVIELLERVSFL